MNIQNFLQIVHTFVDIADSFLFCFVMVLFALNLLDRIVIPTKINKQAFEVHRCQIDRRDFFVHFSIASQSRIS